MILGKIIKFLKGKLGKNLPFKTQRINIIFVLTNSNLFSSYNYSAERTFFLSECEYVADKTPGPGNYNPRVSGDE